MKTSIAIVDDHHLVAQALASLIQKFEEYEVIFFAENGQDLLSILAQRDLPDIILLDLVMPVLDGFATAEQLKKQYPAIKIIALSMHDDEERIMRMLRLGARGFLPKGCRPAELKKALDDVRDKQYHF
jgi:two-component system invasion response regulator UvrY